MSDAKSGLGCFSVSLAVKDLQASKVFYEMLGFEAFGGDEKFNYLIMKNGDTNIGLFQGMFEHNILTFNPGWDQNAQGVEEFEDVRAIEARLAAAGIEIDAPSEAEEGPAHIVLKDPDGNTIMFDQHVPKPE